MSAIPEEISTASPWPSRTVVDSDASPGVCVRLDSVSSHYGKFKALDEVSLDIAPGEFVSLLGPSGSGKTTVLMNIAGFQRVSSGSITVGNKNVTKLPPHRRDFGVVFQRYALFPHMTVADNIEYPLKLRRLARGERRKLRQEALELVGLDGYANHKPSQLSGGQQQRVALARVLVYRPPLILFDEPLGALDRGLREQVQLEIRRLNKELGITMLFVTHDQEEALVMSDRVALMHGGRIEQFAAGRDLYYRPASRFAAEFLGRTNLLDAVVTAVNGASAEVSVMDHRVAVPLPVGSRVRANEKCTIAVRPESVRVAAQSSDHGIAGTVEEAVFSGPTTFLTIRTAEHRLLVHGLSSESRSTVSPGDPVRLTFVPDLISFIPPIEA